MSHVSDRASGIWECMLEDTEAALGSGVETRDSADTYSKVTNFLFLGVLNL